MNDQDDSKRLREIVEPCQRCGGFRKIRGLRLNPGVDACACINADLPIPEISEGRLSFKLKGKNAD